MTGTMDTAVGVTYDRAPRSEDVVWQLRGICNNYDPDIFQPDTVEDEEVAKAICRNCPVMLQCQAWALNKREQAGVWGGLSEDDRAYIWTGRRKSRRRHRKSPSRKRRTW